MLYMLRRWIINCSAATAVEADKLAPPSSHLDLFVLLKLVDVPEDCIDVLSLLAFLIFSYV